MIDAAVAAVIIGFRLLSVEVFALAAMAADYSIWNHHKKQAENDGINQIAMRNSWNLKAKAITVRAAVVLVSVD